MYKSKPCNCGSGRDRHALVDAAGVFVTYVCDKCEAEKRKRYNPRIFSDWYDADQAEVIWPGDR